MKKTVLSLCMLAGLAGGCSGQGDDDDATTASPSPSPTPAAEVNLIQSFPEPPAGGAQWRSPELVIPPFSEKQWCYVTRYTGETTAIHSAQHYQSDYGHHVLFLGTSLDETQYPDGTLFDCTDTASNIMAEFEPIYVVVLEGTKSYLELPEGMAVKLKQNTRFIIQSHYLNTSDKAIRVQDAVNIEYMKPEDVKEWAAPFAHTLINFSLPPNAETTQSLTCTWTAPDDSPLYMLFTYGHMHEWGKRFSLDMTTSEGTELLYSVPEWKAEYRDAPQVDQFGKTEFPIYTGDQFTTTCTWFNDTDRTMTFPEEMCATTGMVWPAVVPIICTD